MGTLSLSDYKDVQIPVPWGQVAGRWYGNQVERPILAIHGWLDNVGTFDTLIPLMPDYLGVLCIELPGHGRSSHMPPGMHNTTTNGVALISMIVKEYKWEKVSLMAHSLGAVLSFIYTALKPQTVDMIITLDIVLPYLESTLAFMYIPMFIDSHLVDDLTAAMGSLSEPPCYTLDQINDIVSRGTNNTVPIEYAKHLVYRAVAKSKLYPDRYYLTRDQRIRYYSHFPFDADYAAVMASRMKSVPYLVIKGTESSVINEESDGVISFLKAENPNFEFHEVLGDHHVHLVNAQKCAEHIVPFLKRHRPPNPNREKDNKSQRHKL